MSQYSEILDRITLDFLNRPDLRPEATRAVKAAIRTYETRRWWFNETATALTTSAGQTYVDMPADLLALDELRLSAVPLLERTLGDLLNMRGESASAVTGTPGYFTQYGNRFELGVVPNSAYAIDCHYIHKLADLSADTDTNAWTTFGENLIVHTATLDILIGVLQGSDAAIARHAAAATAGLLELTTQNCQRQAHRLTPTK